MTVSENMDVSRYITAIRTEIDLVTGTIRDKGAKRFGRTLGISAFLIAAAYYGVYLPPQKKSAALAKQFAAARAMSESGGAYTDLRAQLAACYESLPNANDQQWLSNAVIESLRSGGLTPESLRPASETEGDGLIFQSVNVQMTLRFNEVYGWLQRLEKSDPILRIGTVEIVKRPLSVGYNAVSATVTTVIPKKRFN